MKKNTPKLALLGVLFASIGFGLVPLFARDLVEAGLSGSLISLARYSLGGILLLPFLKLRRSSLWAFGSGLFLGLGYVGYISALEYVPIATAGVLYMSFPLFTLLVGILFFRDPPSKSAILSALAILMAALIVGIPQGLKMGESIFALVGVLLAPLGISIAINVLTHKLQNLSPLSRVAATAFGSIVGLLPFAYFTGGLEVLPNGSEQWGGLLLLALITAFIPQLVFTASVPQVGASRTAVIGSIELPTMFVVGFFAYGDKIQIYEIIAGVIVVCTMILSSSRRTRGLRLHYVKPKPPRAVEEREKETHSR